MRDRNYYPYQKELFSFAQKVYQAGFVSGSSGNLSLRVPEEKNRFVITPTSIAYDQLALNQMVVIDGKGNLVVDSNYLPSIETPMHLAIYQAYPEVQAIIHTHSIYSTALAVLRKPIPAILEELVIYTGGEVPVAKYAPAGSKELARNAVKALKKASAILLANHGNLCVGKTLAQAFNLCALVERSARIYLSALGKGKIHLLPKKVIEQDKRKYIKSLSGK